MTHGKRTHQKEWDAEKQFQECVVRNSGKVEILPNGTIFKSLVVFKGKQTNLRNSTINLV